MKIGVPVENLGHTYSGDWCRGVPCHFATLQRWRIHTGTGGGNHDGISHRREPIRREDAKINRANSAMRQLFAATKTNVAVKHTPQETSLIARGH